MLLKSHCGWDIGANTIYTSLINSINCKHIKAKWSRLLVDLNRTKSHLKLFSEITKPLSTNRKHEIIDQYYLPYRKQAQEVLLTLLKASSTVIHVSVHTFASSLHGKVRNNDIGLLYNPKRIPEKQFSEIWKKLLLSNDKALKVRFNYPYLGISDGFTSYFRDHFPENKYIGIELEVNQKHFTNQGKCKSNILKALKTSLKQIEQQYKNKKI